MAATTTSEQNKTFVIVPGDRHAEVARTLAEPVPQALSLFDQFGLWGNLGVSLLGFTGAIFVLQPGGAGTPELSLAAALTAIVVGTVLGTLPVALAGLPGVRTGAPAMVLLRGLFGARLSYLPTVLNIAQCVGWGVFELVTIATAAHTVAPALPKTGYVLIAGAATALLTIRPLGAIRVLRKYATGAVLVVLCYLFVQLIRHPLPGLTHGTWSGYWAATDTVVAVAISWAPLVADYTRHSRSQRAAFAGVLAGYSVTQVLCYVIGLLALVTVAHGNPDQIYGAFIALPLGALGFAILAARELDQSFANVYSTAVSAQNLRPLWDRRVLAGVIAAVTTVGALWLNIADYENFLTLIGSVFVPLSAVLIADYFVVSRGRWDLSAAARSRWLMLRALGRRLRHLPARQPRLRVLVGVGLDIVRPGHRLHLGQLDVGLDPVIRRGRGHYRGGRPAAPLAQSLTEGPHAVHGMGRELAEPDWLPLTDDELLGILGRSDPGGLGRQPVVIWRSPRPMSAAALVRHGDVTVFVKRHHVSVRTPEQLAVEHEFATHLRTRGLPVPAVVRLADGRVRAAARGLLLRGAPGRRRRRPVPRRGQLVAVRQPGTRVRGGRGAGPPAPGRRGLRAARPAPRRADELLPGHHRAGPAGRGAPRWWPRAPRSPPTWRNAAGRRTSARSWSR